jgi:hypothetical protein
MTLMTASCRLLRFVVALAGAVSGPATAAIVFHTGRLEISGETGTQDYFVFSLSQPAKVTATARWLFRIPIDIRFFVGVNSMTIGAQLSNVSFSIGPPAPVIQSRELNLSAGLYFAVLVVTETNWDPTETNSMPAPYYDLV